MDLYFYKITNDDGGAPCIYRGVLSLAICKPNIRKAAGRHDWVFGFGGQRLGERLIYIAEVTEKRYQGDYYRLPEYADRPDRIYKWVGDAILWKRGSSFHPNGAWAHKDVGVYPHYKRAYVLLSANFRYFGEAGTAEYKIRFPALRERVERLTQGERVHHDPTVRAELLALRDRVWTKHPREMELGKPCDLEDLGKYECPPDDDDEVDAA